MDTEEQLEIQKATREGHPHTDEGPYYHEAWWESYKGSVKGKLGGSIIGAAVGLAVGIVAVGVLAAVGALSTAALSTGLMVAGGFSAAGMLYGAHEFGEIGKNVGSNAAVAEKQEQRENVRFAALEKKLDDIKIMISGKKPVPPATPDVSDDTTSQGTTEHRTTHCDEHCPPQKPKFVFWKIAAIGLAVGLAAGALLAGTGMAHIALEHLGEVGKSLAEHATLTSMTAMGLFGASFGINRDMFRQVFDRTDLLFKGIFHKDKAREPQITVAQAPEQEFEKPVKKPDSHPITTVVYDGYIDYPQSDTFWQDRKKALSAANEALHRLDPNCSRPH